MESFCPLAGVKQCSKCSRLSSENVKKKKLPLSFFAFLTYFTFDMAKNKMF